MLGYVQSENEFTWAGKLATASAARPALLIAEQWSDYVGEGFPKHTYRTGHRDSAGTHMNVLHVLLGFTPPQG
jgi:sarcosine oxidase delta subunit